MNSRSLLLTATLLVGQHTQAFSPSTRQCKYGIVPSTTTTALSSLAPEKSYVLTEEEVGPVVKLKIGSKGNDKIINIFGGFTVLVTIITGAVWSLAMTITEALDTNPNSNRAAYDYTGKIWSRIFMFVTNSYPEINGLENINVATSQSLDVQGSETDEKQGILYVANHCSWLDIPVLCCAVDPVFKFIAKGDLVGVPFIGQQLRGVSV